jgi:hypothetical protein
VDQPVVLQRDGEAVSGRPGQPGRLHELGQGGGPGFEGVQDEHRFVKYAHSARVVHASILPSRNLRCKSCVRKPRTKKR